MMILSQRIKELRKEHNISQIDLAKKCMVKQSCISKWERGATLPDAEMIVKLTEIFNVSADYLLGIKDY
ncbi:MAG: helix-turn-helix transcriptional regulator [Clostridia bacterium]|nr:helix-turn-helix transcriptional regulator [Clostridia bacterium]